LSEEGDATEKVSVASEESSVRNTTSVDILGRMDGTSPAFGEQESDDPGMDMLPFQDNHVFFKDQDVYTTETLSDADISTSFDVLFPIDSGPELDRGLDMIDKAIIPSVEIVSTFFSVVVPAFHAIYLLDRYLF
jgi:hypothetical protein